MTLHPRDVVRQTLYSMGCKSMLWAPTRMWSRMGVIVRCYCRLRGSALYFSELLCGCLDGAPEEFLLGPGEGDAKLNKRGSIGQIVHGALQVW